MSRSPVIWITLLLLIVLLFGSSKLPDLARAVGQSLKILKKDVGDLRDDDTRATPADGASPTASTAQPAAPAVQSPASPVAPAAPPATGPAGSAASSTEPGPTAGTGDVPPAEGSTPPRA